MKSELKEIQESNLLADKIEGFLIKVKQKLPLIIGVVVVGTVLLLASGIYKTWSDSISAKGWSALYFSDTEASDFRSTPIVMLLTNTTRKQLLNMKK